MLRKISLFFLILLSGVAGLALVAQNVPQIKLSPGDPVAGQKVFAEMRCYTCHYVGGEAGKTYPNPVSTAPAPLLGPKLAEQKPLDVATSIVAPSHKVSQAAAAESGGKLSPMASYEGLLDEKQLSDLVAYLRSLGEPAR
ncbi:MAG TPA: hypothetical protein DD490_13630 [Acidobacteria bacterium]|nr:hypothetical protein [Acidobacteriota bacterium]